MAERTAQLIGFSDGCEITITWNHVAVFHDSVTAAGTKDELMVLAEWSTDTEILGDVPLVIECLSGSLHFANIRMNMFASVAELQLTSEPDWPTYTPTEQELLIDLSQLTNEQIEVKYGLTRSDIRQHISRVELLSIENNFCQPLNATDLIPNDGKKSVTIDEVGMARENPGAIGSGAWHWLIQEGQILRCLFQVDAPVA